MRKHCGGVEGRKALKKDMTNAEGLSPVFLIALKVASYNINKIIIIK
jgi:hypothetical protein